MAEISLIPSRDELLSKLLGSIQSPIPNFARVMKQLAEKGGAGACEAPAAQEEAAEAPAAEAEMCIRDRSRSCRRRLCWRR